MAEAAGSIRIGKYQVEVEERWDVGLQLRPCVIGLKRHDLLTGAQEVAAGASLRRSIRRERCFVVLVTGVSQAAGWAFFGVSPLCVWARRARSSYGPLPPWGLPSARSSKLRKHL